MKRATRKKQKVYQFGPPFTKRRGTPRSLVPEPQQLRIVEKYMRGLSLRRIAEEEDRARQTVSKIVRAPEMQNYVERLREKVFGLGDDAARSLGFAFRTELDGRLAYQFLRDIGIFQPQDRATWNGQMSSTELQKTEASLVEDWTSKLNLMAIEKSIVYGAALPAALQSRARELTQTHELAR
jgi:hypothetical protein